MGADKDGGSGVGEFAQSLPQIAAGERIEAAGWLIEDEDARAVQQSFRKHHALRLAAGKLLAPARPLVS